MIRPLSDRILIRPYVMSDLSLGGIYLGEKSTTFVADKAKTKQTTVGEVLAVGPGKDVKGRRRPPDVPIGSFVTFSDTCGKSVEVDGETLLFITEPDVVGFLDKPTDVELLYEAS